MYRVKPDEQMHLEGDLHVFSTPNVQASVIGSKLKEVIFVN